MLTLEQLRSYEQLYPYSLQQQWQQLQAQQVGQQQERQRLLQVSSGQVVGRPGSAGVGREYQPLLQQQMTLQEQLMQQQREQPLPWQQAGAGSSQQQQQRVPQQPIAAEPWHTGKPRWQSHAAAVAATGLHWAEKRAAGRTGLVPAGSSDGSSSSRSSSPSTASALVGSAADLGSYGQQQQQQHHRVDLRKSHDWAAKALRPVSPAAAAGRAGHSTTGSATRPRQSGSSSREQLPSFGGQVLPNELAALFGSQHGRHTF
jgi:hypothetical protein